MVRVTSFSWIGSSNGTQFADVFMRGGASFAYWHIVNKTILFKFAASRKEAPRVEMEFCRLWRAEYRARF